MTGAVVILTSAPDMPVGAAIPPGATVIAADGGAEKARSLSLGIDLLVGDLDSVSSKTLASVERVQRHAVDKDATDLELAVQAALALKPERILVLGGAEGRLDHLLGGLLLLTNERLAAVQVDAQLGSAAVHVIRNERTLAGNVGEVISLFAVNEPALGVLTEGLVYPLHAETLEPNSSRGVSNLFAESHARIALERGVLLAVRPDGSAMAGG